MEHIDAISCIKGEIHSVMTSMRLSTRWSNTKNSSTKGSDFQEESPFVNSFRKLNEYLEGIFILDDIEVVLYITPFYEVVVSDQASGPLTSVALSSLCKFSMFGFLSTRYPKAQEGMALVAKCISRCIFEETDWESDEVILMKLLELSTLILRCDASKLLTVEPMWDIYSTCLSIHNQNRASKILRSEAETALRHLTQSTFSKAHSICSPVEAQSWENTKGVYVFDGSAGITMLLCNIMKVLSNLMNLQSESPTRVKFALSILNIALEAGGPELSSMEPLVEILKGDVCRHLLRATQSEDLDIFSLALRVIFNLFMSIKDHMKVQLEVFLTSIHLRILQTHQSSFLGQAKEELALESMLEFCREPSLMQDLYTNYDCDVQCTNLFDAIITVLCERSQPVKQKKDKDGDNSPVNIEYKPSIINRLAITGVSSILHSLAVKCRKSRNAMTFINSVHDFENKSLIQSMIPAPTGNVLNTIIETNKDDVYKNSIGTAPASVSFQPLPSILEQSHHAKSMNTSIKSVLTETFSPDKSDAPSPAQSPSLSLSASVSNISVTLDENDSSFVQVIGNPVEILRMRKLKKQRLLHTAELFNEKPLKSDWIKFALDHQLVKPYTKDTDSKYPADPKSIAYFLKETPGLGKTQIGEFISKGPADVYPFHASVLQEYVDTFDFAAQEASFVKALRSFLGHFRLPGEAQCIDRLMEAFAKKLYADLGCGKPFLSADAAFVLAFSTIMLQTDLHNPNVTHKRMSQEEFIRNNRGINDGESLPKEYLEALYEEIKSKKIEVDIEISDNSSQTQVFHLTDTASWDKLMKKSAAFQAPANFTPTVRARKKTATNFNLVSLDPVLSMHEKDMFLVMEDRLMSSILMLWQFSDDDKIVSKTFQMMWDYAGICIDLQLPSLFNHLFQTCIMKTRTILESCRKLHSNSDAANKLLSNTFYQKLWGLECMYGKHELQKLLKSSIEDLLMPEGNMLMASEPVNWIGVTLVKGEVMAKFVLSLAGKFSVELNRQSWISLVYFLVWIRNKGALPPTLAHINYQWNFDTSYPLDFSKFQPSICVAMCNRRARGLVYQKSTVVKKNNPSWLGGLFWSPGNGGENTINQLNPANSDHSSSDLANFDLNVSLYNELSQSENENINMDKLLAIAIQDSSFQNYWNMTEMRDKRTSEDVTSVLSEVLIYFVPKILSADSENISKDNTDENTLLPKFGTFELDAVLLLELMTKISSGDLKAILNNWSKIHTILKLILDDDVETACSNMPFFLERFSLFIMRCACETIPHITITEYFNIISQKNIDYTHPSLRKGYDAIWQSLRLLRNLPSEFIEGISGQIGQALLYFVRPSSSTVRLICSLEEWYLIFSLMSNVIMRADARPYVWMSLHHIISQNLISDTNFSPARNLLLRFLYGTFVEESSYAEEDGGRKQTSIEWQNQSMICLVRLTNMALGGYLQQFSSVSSPAEGENVINAAATTEKLTMVINQVNRIKSGANSFKMEFIKFPLPQPRGNSPRKHIKDNTTSMTVPCVYFSRAVEIELFWIETCKTFCDLSNAGDQIASQQALYCLEAVLLSGTNAKLNNEIFLKALDEVLSRLPLSLLLANDRVHNSANSNPQVNLVYEYCSDSCELLLQSLVDNFSSIRKLSGFQSSWLRFVSILATNANMLIRGSHVHNKMLDMMASLVQVLKVSKQMPSINEVTNQSIITEQGILANDVTETASSDDSNDSLVLVSTPPTSSTGNAVGGWLSWWGSPVPMPPAPVPVPVTLPAKIDSAIKKPQIDETVQPVVEVTANVLSFTSQENTSPRETQQQTLADDNDNELLFITWNTACSLYQSLPVHLRIKYPQLVSQIVSFIEKYEKLNNVQAVKEHVPSSNPLVQVV